MPSKQPEEIRNHKRGIPVMSRARPQVVCLGITSRFHISKNPSNLIGLTSAHANSCIFWHF